MHAESDTVMENLSIRPSVRASVRQTQVLYLNECTYRQTLSTL